MAIIHFLNVLEGDCNIIQHDSGRVTVIDVSNASNEEETFAERTVRTSAERQKMLMRTQVPTGKNDYRQKLQPDNPIQYLKEYAKESKIFRFIITHPDMDHLDGIRDLFDSFQPNCFWDTDNKKQIENFNGGGYNKEDWEFYLKLRDGKYRSESRRAFYAGYSWDYFKQDCIQVLAPTPKLLQDAIANDDYNDSSYVLLFTPPKKGGKQWKILFAGDSHDATWSYITKNFSDLVSNVDILIAPHHGRDSKRSYDFLKTVNPTITLFGNASSEHLAYDKYPEIRITNNQAGYIIMDVNENQINLYVKNKEFANDFRSNPKRKWGNAPYNEKLKAYNIGSVNA